MAETTEGPVRIGWNYGDPPVGFYWLALRCEVCGAPSGHLWPEADARATGTRFIHHAGSSAGICRRCRRTSTMIVESALPKKPITVEPWSY